MRQFKFFEKKVDLKIPEGYKYHDTTPLIYNPYTFSAIKWIIIKHIDTGETIKHHQITEGHPLWNN